MLAYLNNFIEYFTPIFIRIKIKSDSSMSKFFKRIAKESVKFTADFVVSNLTVMAEEDCYVRLQI